LAAEIESANGVSSELIRGDDGIFDVVVDGELRFSKHASNRFPEPGEILALIRT